MKARAWLGFVGAAAMVLGVLDGVCFALLPETLKETDGWLAALLLSAVVLVTIGFIGFVAALAATDEDLRKYE